MALTKTVTKLVIILMLVLIPVLASAQMQVQVSKVSVTDNGEQFGSRALRVIMNLKCWEALANPEVDDPIINYNFSAYYKATEGFTVDQRVAQAATQIQTAMQKVIDTYKREQQLLNHVRLDQAVIDIQAGLEASQ